MGKVFKKGLGRGIEAIIPRTGLATGRSITYLPIHEIKPNRFQPRSEFNIKALEDLASSIKTYGVTQPVLVRRYDGAYELIAGERRLRASKIAGLESIPVVIKEYNDKEALEIAIIENIQREDLNVLEEAEAFKRLKDEFGITQEEIAERVGKSRSVVANSLRLLELPDQIKDSIRKKEISPSHARTLLAIENTDERIKLWNDIVNEKLNVRQAEQIAQTQVLANNQKKPGHLRKKESDAKTEIDIFLRNLQEDLCQILKTKVVISGSNSIGKIEINYFSFDDLERFSDFVRTHPKAY